MMAAMAARPERRLVERLRDAGAFSHGRAVPLLQDTRSARRQLAHLVHVGAVHQTADGCWLDESAYGAYRVRRRRAAGFALLAAAAVAAAFSLAARR
ncbi:MAG: hypothetical protein ACXWZ4_09700 [Gemmatirosa sp.]